MRRQAGHECAGRSMPRWAWLPGAARVAARSGFSRNAPLPSLSRLDQWDWIAALVTATIAGGITGAIAQAFASPSLLGRVGFGNGGAAIGFILGFLCTLVAMALARKLSGRRSVNSYPPVVSLQQLGWRLLSD